MKALDAERRIGSLRGRASEAIVEARRALILAGYPDRLRAAEEQAGRRGDAGDPA